MNNKSIAAFDRQATVILTLFWMFACYWLRGFVRSEPFSAVDLPGHIALIERLRDQLLHGNIFFYDRFWFTGWPAYEYYAPLGHIITAILSYPLTLISEEPVTLATHSIMVGGLAILPVGIYYLSWPYLKELLSANESLSLFSAKRFSLTPQGLLAIIVATTSYWFINSSAEQSLGIGFVGPFSVGLYTQLFGWLFLLFYLGVLARLLGDPTKECERLVVLAYTLIFLTHSLTAIFALCFAGLCWCWFSTARKSIFRAHLISFLISSFWFLPFLAYSGEMRIQSPFDHTADFFEIFFRYPLINIIDTFSSWVGGDISGLDIASLVIPFLLPMAFLHPRIRKSKLILPILIILIFLQMLSASKFSIRSIPMEIHFYRFIPYSILAILGVISVVPFAFIGSNKSWRTFSVVVTILSATMFCSIFLFSAEGYKDRIKELGKKDLYKSHHEVLDYFYQIGEESRVLFEYSQRKISPGTAHYLPSKLSRMTKHESANGLFIQSSLAFVMLGSYAGLIQLPVFSYGPQFFHSQDDYNELQYLDSVEQMKEFGVTHIVALTVDFKMEFKEKLPFEFIDNPPQNFGNFTVFNLKNDFLKVQNQKKRVVGFIDLKKNLSFKLMEFLFHGNSKLISNIALINVDLTQPFPDEMDTLLVNTNNENEEDLKKLLKDSEMDHEIKIIPINFKVKQSSSHYRLLTGRKQDEELFLELSKYLMREKNIEELLAIEYGPKENPQSADTPNLVWDPLYQSFTLSNLTPGKLVRINYSFFPYWTADSGEIYRGIGERMFFKPTQTTAKFVYNRNGNTVVKIGYVITLFGLLVAIFLYRPFITRRKITEV